MIYNAIALKKVEAEHPLRAARAGHLPLSGFHMVRRLVILVMYREEIMDTLSLIKYVARCGIGSRRRITSYIKEGQISVDDVPIKDPNFPVTSQQVVRYKNSIIAPTAFIYLIVNKPKDYITSLADQRNRKTVLKLVEQATALRIFPVGRLDRNSTGLLLFTNDGQLAQKLSHPRFNVKKIYHVTLDKPVTQAHVETIKKGVMLEDGPLKVDSISYIPHTHKTQVQVELHSGRNRIVRRLFAAYGYEVIKLDRIAYATLRLKGLSRGHWRFLTDQEVDQLKKL